ncbi:MAG: hypothetical protein IIW21_03360, partial [Clostridia bacterium]|nr:hypothetical protein [Clostridia bacterium]
VFRVPVQGKGYTRTEINGNIILQKGRLFPSTLFRFMLTYEKMCAIINIIRVKASQYLSC